MSHLRSNQLADVLVRPLQRCLSSVHAGEGLKSEWLEKADDAAVHGLSSLQRVPGSTRSSPTTGLSDSRMPHRPLPGVIHSTAELIESSRRFAPQSARHNEAVPRTSKLRHEVPEKSSGREEATARPRLRLTRNWSAQSKPPETVHHDLATTVYPFRASAPVHAAVSVESEDGGKHNGVPLTLAGSNSSAAPPVRAKRRVRRLPSSIVTASRIASTATSPQTQEVGARVHINSESNPTPQRSLTNWSEPDLEPLETHRLNGVMSPPNPGSPVHPSRPPPNNAAINSSTLQPTQHAARTNSSERDLQLKESSLANILLQAARRQGIDV